MKEQYTIIAFAGSLRKNSFNRGLIRAAVALAPKGITIMPIDITELPMFNADLETQYPAEIIELKNKIRSADAILLATPEYNRSLSGVLKNMLDWTSRPYGDNPWSGKPVATMGAGGMLGTSLAQYHLKQILLYLNARVLGQPELYVTGAKAKFAENGDLTDENTKEHISKLLLALAAFIG